MRILTSLFHFVKNFIKFFLPSYMKIKRPLNTTIYYIKLLNIENSINFNIMFFIKMMLDDDDNFEVFISVILSKFILLFLLIGFIKIYYNYFLSMNQVNLIIFLFIKYFLLFIMFLVVVVYLIVSAYFLVKLSYTPFSLYPTLEILEIKINKGSISNFEELNKFLDRKKAGVKIKEAIYFIELCGVLNLDPKENLPLQYKEVLEFPIIVDFYNSIEVLENYEKLKILKLI